MRRRGLTEADRALWARYASLVAPLPGVTLLSPPPAPVIPVAAPTSTPAPTPPPQARAKPGAAPLAIGHAPGGVDRATFTRFRTGKLPATRTLDLHGRTANRAHAALDHFLHLCAAEGIRCVEVITGRGSGEQGGVIRREFPLWLNAPNLRPLILAAAHPHPQNPGSVRLLLKRARTPPSPLGRGPG